MRRVEGRWRCMMEGVDAVTRGRTALDPVEAYAAAAERFAVTVAWSDLAAPVATCPGWSVRDLVIHLGNVHAWAATVVETGAKAVEQDDRPRSGAKGRAVSAWYAGKAEDLYEVLRHTPADRPTWNFVFGDGVASFWSRRQLHETTIHLMDLDATGSRTTEVASEVCVDGIDEVLSTWLHRMHRRHPADLTRPVALIASDTGDTWVLSPQGPASPPSVQHRRTSGTAVPDRVEAPVETLYRLLWQRSADAPDVSVAGDEERVRAFLGSRLTP